MFSSPEALIVRSTQWLHSRFTIRSTLQRTGPQFTLLAHITDTPAAFIRPFSTFLELKPLLSVLPISLCGSYSNTVLLRRCGAAGAEGGVTVDQFNRPCDGVCVFQVVLLGMDILSALVSRLQERFRTQVGTGEPLLVIYCTHNNSTTT